MAVVDETKAGGRVEETKAWGRQPGYCPGCGHPVTGVRYCPECGHAQDIGASTSGRAGDQAPLDQTQVLPPRPPTARPPEGTAGGERGRSRALLIAIPLVLVIAVAAVAIIVVSNSNSNQSTPSSYRQKLTIALAPVITANRSLSVSLQSIDGSRKTTSAAQNATVQAQSAVAGAQGAIAVLTVPSSDTTLSQQVQQALTEESGYLQAVSSTLANPASQSASQVRTLVTATQSGLVLIVPVAAGATGSLTGTDNLISWASNASAAAQQASQRKAAQQAAPRTQTVTQQAPPTTTAPSSSPSGLTACDQNISVNSSTTCAFADNVFTGYAQGVQQAGGPGSYNVYAYSPTTGQYYTDTCNYNPTDQIVLCSHGSDLIQFPYWAASVYR